jgi:hypothetical protein
MSIVWTSSRVESAARNEQVIANTMISAKSISEDRSIGSSKLQARPNRDDLSCDVESPPDSDATMDADLPE